ncbi:MAG: hypothetical protein JWQ96_1322 [Segetibacter sp.]|nr:hypothetical protein [Segetibacter sp.]
MVVHFFCQNCYSCYKGKSLDKVFEFEFALYRIVFFLPHKVSLSSDCAVEAGEIRNKSTRVRRNDV